MRTYAIHINLSSKPTNPLISIFFPLYQANWLNVMRLSNWSVSFLTNLRYQI